MAALPMLDVPAGKMILVGRYLSPYTRIVGVSLKLMDFAFVHWPLSTLEDQENIRRFNPLCRIPALICEDGKTLIDSRFIVDYLNERADPSLRLIPLLGDERREVAQCMAIGFGSCEKLVASIYERLRRPPETQYRAWLDQLDRQTLDGILALENMLGERPWFFGRRPSLADVTAIVVYEFLQYMLPELAPADRFPNLSRLSLVVRDVDAFKSTLPQRAKTEIDALQRLSNVSLDSQ